mgnify:CR=1 FL=1
MLVLKDLREGMAQALDWPLGDVTYRLRYLQEAGLIPTGRGGAGGANRAGSLGSVGAGIYLSNSSLFDISGNTLSQIQGGSGGLKGGDDDDDAHGLDQQGYGIFLSEDAQNNDVSVDPLNTLEGEPIFYLHQEDGVEIKDQVLVAHVQPTNWGKIAVLNS